MVAVTWWLDLRIDRSERKEPYRAVHVRYYYAPYRADIVTLFEARGLLYSYIIFCIGRYTLMSHI